MKASRLGWSTDERFCTCVKRECAESDAAGVQQMTGLKSDEMKV